jgi:PPOX class probable F420-dependent enzyme
MPTELDADTDSFLREHRVARLATVDEHGQPYAVPICYVFDGQCLYTPIDEKPKRVLPADLKRVRNIKMHPQVAIVVDDYFEEWDRLRYVFVAGIAEIIDPSDSAEEHSEAVRLLRKKYDQYGSMAIDELPIIKIIPVRIKSWTPNSRRDR